MATTKPKTRVKVCKRNAGGPHVVATKAWTWENPDGHRGSIDRQVCSKCGKVVRWGS